MNVHAGILPHGRAGRSRIGATPVRIEHVGLDAQRLRLDDGACDAALCAFTLCTVGPGQALAEVRRVSERWNVHFLEHGLSPDPGVEPSGNAARTAPATDGRRGDSGPGAPLATLGHLMCGGDDLHDSGPARRPRWLVPSGALVLSLGLALLVAACTTSNPGTQGLADPTTSVTPKPDYADVCAPVGADTTTTCLRITLGAIDAARAAEGLRPMLLPADFARLTVPEQLFVAIDRERVDRGLAPFTGLVASLDTDAQRGARAAQLPSRPGSDFASTATEWIGEIDNGLDADFQWVYDDGPDSGVVDCSCGQDSGCWADRKIVLGRFPAHSGHLVMGAAYDPDQ